MDFDCENICTKRCAGPCQGRPTRSSPVADTIFAIVLMFVTLVLFFSVIWGFVHAAGLDRGE